MVTLRREAPPEPTAAEREVADLLPIEAGPKAARAVLDRVPLWFHTFSLERSDELYTPGVARNHRYRIPALPEDFSGMSVLDVGTFDGFYAFLAEARGARRVVAVDNERSGENGSARAGAWSWMEARDSPRSGSYSTPRSTTAGSTHSIWTSSLRRSLDLILCFGILHRVENPMGLLKTLRRRLAAGGQVLLETYGSADRTLESSAAVHIPSGAGEVYARSSSTGASPPQVWTRWPGMRASRASS